MPIDVDCRCGVRISVPDHFAGRSGKCKSCGGKLVIPAPKPALLDDRFDFSEAELLAAAKARSGEAPPAEVATIAPGPAPEIVATAVHAPKPRSRPRLDPIVIMGVLVPAAIVFWFAFYLYRDQKQKAFEAQVRELKAEGDRLDKAGHPEDAYRQYAAAISLAKDSRVIEPQTKDDLIVARDRSVQLFAVAKKSEDERIAMQKRAEAEERDQQERESKIADIRRRLESENKAYLDDQASISGRKATISGAAFITTKDGKSVIIRGLDIFLLRRRVPKGEVEDTINILAKRSKNESQDLLVGILNFMPPDHRVDLAGIRDLVRDTSDGFRGDDPEIRFLSVAKDSVWVNAIIGAVAEHTNTNVEGKFKFRDVPGGDYYIYAMHQTMGSLAEWMIPIRVDKDEPIEQELFNKNAELILNRSGN